MCKRGLGHVHGVACDAPTKWCVCVCVCLRCATGVVLLALRVVFLRWLLAWLLLVGSRGLLGCSRRLRSEVRRVPTAPLLPPADQGCRASGRLPSHPRSHMAAYQAGLRPNRGGGIICFRCMCGAAAPPRGRHYSSGSPFSGPLLGALGAAVASCPHGVHYVLHYTCKYILCFPFFVHVALVS